MNSIHPPALHEESSLVGLGARLPPASMEAEQALLGALLANNKAYERVSEFLEAEHFVDAIHGRIYSAIRRKVENGQLADAVTLRHEFEHTGELAEVGGPAYLTQLLTVPIKLDQFEGQLHLAGLGLQLVVVAHVEEGALKT